MSGRDTTTVRRDTTTVRGPQNPLVGGFEEAKRQGGGIVPDAQRKVVEDANRPIAGPKEIFNTLASFFGGKKNSSNSRMSPTTTKDK